MPQHQNNSSETFFNNFTSGGDTCLDLTKDSSDLLGDMYASEAIASQAAEITAASHLDEDLSGISRPLSSLAHFADTASDVSAGFLLGSWFNREFIIRRVFDVFRYSVLSILVFAIVFAAANWESYWARTVYTYQNMVGTYDLSRVNFVANLSSEFKQYRNEARWKTEDEAARRALVQEARADLTSSPQLAKDIIPELGFTAPIPAPLTVSSVSYNPLSTESRIIIPKIKVNAPLAWPFDRDEDNMLTALEDGVAHFPGTAMPGQYGNTFLTGHSSYYAWAPGDYKSVFVLLDKMAIGDDVTLWHEGQEYTYTIYDKFIVSPDNLDVLEQTPGEKLLTLMTCTPIGTNTNRLIYRARLASS